MTRQGAGSSEEGRLTAASTFKSKGQNQEAKQGKGEEEMTKRETKVGHKQS